MVDLKEEQKYRRLMRLAQELHIPIPEAFIELEVFDKDGRLIQRHKQRSHSWVRNAYNHIFSQLAGKNASDGTFGAGKLSIKDYLGVIKSGAKPITIKDDWNCDVAGGASPLLATDDFSGILVGSGTNAESFEDYELQTKIGDGVGAGQISYVNSELHSISYTDTTLMDTLIRYFNNNTGEDRNINEVGLFFNGFVNGAQVRWLHSRDKLASTVTVPDTGQLKVTYTIQLTYPA